MGRVYLEPAPAVTAMSLPLRRSGRVFLLADMNAAYASIQTLFQPWLRDRPVVVLSSNDGNVIARNPHAKALGIKMGQPWHEVAPLYRAGRLHVFSPNFALYADLSERFMTIVAREAPAIAPYSIDEVFFDGTGIDAVNDMEAFGQQLRQAVDRELGIPIAVGAGHTKTQAKLANWAAKKWLSASHGMLDIREPARLEKLMRRAPVAEVWGIGPRLARRLGDELGITTAWQLAMADPRLLRRRFSVTVERTARELRGEVCFPLEEGPAPQLSIAATQSFGRKLYRLEDLAAAVASFTARGAGKLRRQQSLTHSMQVFIRTSPFATGTPYSAVGTVAFAQPTDDTRELIAGAQRVLREIYREGPAYAKAGILLSHLVPARQRTGDLFALPGAGKSQAVMQAMDAVNARMGRGTLRVARERATASWEMRRQFLSPHYTTRWSDLPQVW